MKNILSVLFLLVFCMVFFLSSTVPGGEIPKPKKAKKSFENSIPEDYKDTYSNAEYRLVIVFSIKNCTSCLMIIGRIDDEVVSRDKAFAALGVMAENDDYPAEKLREDSDISFPIIKSGIDDTSGTIFSAIPTPYVMMVDRKGSIRSIVHVPYDYEEKTHDSIIKYILSKDYKMGIRGPEGSAPVEE